MPARARTVAPKAVPATAKAAVQSPSPAIVAVGASAGGLEAFTEFLGSLPIDLGMAVVLIQHLQPSHDSYLSRLLQKATHLRVADITDNTEPETNHIYVLPAGKMVRLEQGRLRLRERPRNATEPFMPIDVFMHSLAEERKSGAIGAVLSGTANDGTQGLLAIKQAGGICFAQSEASAEFGGMAYNAIASGSVDFVLTPAEIARELARIAHPPRALATPPGATAAPGAEDGRTYKTILNLLQQHAGVDFSQYRSSTIQRRIARRMALRGLGHMSDYLAYLRAHRPEVGQLVEDLLISATRFFRDPDVFDFFKKKVLAPLVKARRPPNRTLRLWSVGCSSGEEAYSLAIVVLEALNAHGEDGGAVQVFGTDLNEAGIRRARTGRYGPEIEADVSPERLRRFFVKAPQGYRVSKALRDACIFAQHNVLRDAPFSRLDVISCRNMMIYMEPVLQRRIFSTLHFGLNPGGTLVLGSAESTSGASEMFSPVKSGHAHRKLKLYTKLVNPNQPRFDLSAYRPYSLELALHNTAPPYPAPPRDTPQQESDRIILQQFAPTGVIVDANLDVVEFRGRTSSFFEPAPGTASLNLLKLARAELGAYVRSAVLKAQKSDAPVRQIGWLMPPEGQPGTEREIEVHAFPLTAQMPEVGNGSPRPLFLVLFQAVAAAEIAALAKRPTNKESAQEMRRLQRNLAESQKLIRSLSEDFQAAKQEFQAASEEIASANEELQSSNEELETSKEELQSANEEINTINEELRHRNAELHESNGDLQNLIAVADIAVVLLDRELRIRRFSPAVGRLLNLIPADVGRRLGDIRSGLAIGGLDTQALAAVASGAAQQRQVQAANGQRYELRVTPYFTADNQTDGVVMAFTEPKAPPPSLDGAVELIRSLTAAAANPIAVLSHDMRVLRANPIFCTLFGLDGAGAGAVWDQPEMRALVGKLKPKQEARLRLQVQGKTRSLRAVQVTGLDGDASWLVTLDH